MSGRPGYLPLEYLPPYPQRYRDVCEQCDVESLEGYGRVLYDEYDGYRPAHWVHDHEDAGQMQCEAHALREADGLPRFPPSPQPTGDHE